MTTFLYKTKGNSPPERKPRVFFTCHPDDFCEHFDRICGQIFATHDCTVFYTEQMNAGHEEKYLESDLGQMNLFVIPVTHKLLTMPNRAMNFDYRFAREKNIPVLPIMVEAGLDDIYSRTDKFGETQYLSPFANDLTAISFEEKLKKYLEAVLISPEMAERVRHAFDAYIFLSYRKKDRHYANDLMKQIHSHPEFRDIAIWYDEFLTPGESFRESIEKMMADSKMFALLVTPSILERVNGKPNYVMAHEYPEAKAAGMEILPVEMEKTDKDSLSVCYEDIPECADPEETARFKQRLLDALCKVAISQNNEDPEHNYLIGLAYLDGIDVEKNKERGIELITSAAMAGQPEAMGRLYDMYSEGIGVPVDYRKAVVWAERIVQCLEHYCGEEHPGTLAALNNLATAYSDLGYRQRAWELREKVYTLRCKVFGEEHPDTLAALNNMAYECLALGDYPKALELSEKVYALESRVLGEKHPQTLITLRNLAEACGELGEYQKALELKNKLYMLRCEVLGEEHPNTLTALNNLATAYSDLGYRQRAWELRERVYALRRKVLGEEHPDTVRSFYDIALLYNTLEDWQKAKAFAEKAYTLQCKLFGEEHQDTLNTLYVLACLCYKLGDHQNAVGLFEKVYSLQCKVRGETNSGTLLTLHNIAGTYMALEEPQKALEYYKKVYEIKRRVFGEEHAETEEALLAVYLCMRKLYS